MATQYWLNRGQRKRRRFVAFRGGYHGDTLGTMAVTDPEIGMHDMFRRHSARADHCRSAGRRAEANARLSGQCEKHADEIAAIIVEPLVQGAGGMRFHDAGGSATSAQARRPL